MRQCYLKPNVKIEPLIWNWYAWSYLIPPATAACNIVDRHLKIMNSYIMAPEVHAEAVKNPRLLGGPFIDLEEKHLGAIKTLIEKTQNDCISLINLAADLKAFDRSLQLNTEGDSLDGLYQQTPDSLRGLIELVYDLNSHCSIRLIEPLFYQKFSSDNYQQVALSLTFSDERPFVMSTPRIETDDEVYLKVPFHDGRLDILFSARMISQNLEHMLDIFSLPTGKKTLFESFFTEQKPFVDELRNYHNEGIRMRYFGHACVLLQSRNISILVDPIISYKTNSEVERFTFENLPDKIDYVILTHNHQDHVLIETLLQIRYKVVSVVVPNNQKGALADPSLKLILRHLGFQNVISLDDFETLSFIGGKVIGLPFLGEHADLNIQTKLAYYVDIEGKKVLFAADSRSIDPKVYNYTFEQIGEVDILFLGMECDGAPLSWLYGPLLSRPLNRAYDQARKLSGSTFEQAWPLVKQSKCKQVLIYAMGQEPWLSHIMALKYSEQSVQLKESKRLMAKCHVEGIASEVVFGKKELIL